MFPKTTNICEMIPITLVNVFRTVQQTVFTGLTAAAAAKSKQASTLKGLVCRVDD